jgi:LuxR family quorum sensing-dependent transcriptional regulator
MTLVREAISVVKELETVREPLEILSGVQLFTKSFGFEHLTILRKLPDPEKVQSGVVTSSAPADFIADFDARGYAKYNPLIRQAEAGGTPFTGAEVRHRRISEQEHEVLDFIHDRLDLTDGYIIPMRCETNGAGTVLFGGNKPKQDPVTQSVLMMLGHCVYGHIHDLMRAFGPKAGAEEQAAAGPLTPRERECLQWVARGKTDFEIGIILGISARTARFHIENSKRKLGVASRVQAVTAAMRCGSIAA